MEVFRLVGIQRVQHVLVGREDVLVPRAAHLFFQNRLFVAPEHSTDFAGAQVELPHAVTIWRGRRLVLEHEQPLVIAAEGISLIVAHEVEQFRLSFARRVGNSDARALTPASGCASATRRPSPETATGRNPAGTGTDVSRLPLHPSTTAS